MLAVTAKADRRIFEIGVGRVGCLGEEEVKRREVTLVLLSHQVGACFRRGEA